MHTTRPSIFVRGALLGAFLVAILGMAMTAPAHATGSPLEASVNGQVACDPALPIYDTDLRQRPRAVINESRTGVDVFATCGYTWQSNSYGIEWFEVTLSNVGTAAKIATCTAVVGREGGATQYLPKSIGIDGNGGLATLRWSGSALYTTDVALSCKLPLNTGVSRTLIRYRHSN